MVTSNGNQKSKRKLLICLLVGLFVFIWIILPAGFLTGLGFRSVKSEPNVLLR